MSLDRRIWEFIRALRVDYLTLTGRVRTIGAEQVRVIFYDNSGHILVATGLTPPTNDTPGYAKGCLFIKTNAGAGVPGMYENIGTSALCQFSAESATPGELTLAQYDVIRGGAGGAGEALTVAEARVVGRATGGDVDDIQIANEHIGNAAAIALTKLATQNANTINANATAGVATPTAVAIGANEILLRAAGNLTSTAIAANRVVGRLAAGNLGAIQVTGAEIDAAAAIALTQLAVQAANTINANATAGAASPTAVAIGENEVLIRAAGNLTSTAIAESRVLGRLAGGNLGAILITGAEIAAAAAIALTQMANAAANTVIANATAGAAAPTAVAMGASSVLCRLAAGEIVAAQITGAEIAAAAGIALTQMANAAANTVIANATNGAAAPTAVAMGASSVLCRLAAGDIVAAQITGAEIAAAAAIALTQLADQDALTFLVNATNAAAPPTAVALAANQILAVTAGPLVGALAINRKTVLGASATVLTTYALTRGDLLTADADDLVAVPIAQDEVVCGVGVANDLDGVAIADNRVLGRSGGNLASIQIDSAHVVEGAVDPAHMAIKTITHENTAGNVTITPAQMLGGVVVKDAVAGGPFDVTLGANTAAVIAVMGSAVGSWFEFLFQNNDDTVMTIVAADGNMTLYGDVSVAASGSVRIVVIKTAVGTVDAYITAGTT